MFHNRLNKTLLYETVTTRLTVWSQIHTANGFGIFNPPPPPLPKHPEIICNFRDQPQVSPVTLQERGRSGDLHKDGDRSKHTHTGQLLSSNWSVLDTLQNVSKYSALFWGWSWFYSQRLIQDWQLTQGGGDEPYWCCGGVSSLSLLRTRILCSSLSWLVDWRAAFGWKEVLWKVS